MLLGIIKFRRSMFDSYFTTLIMNEKTIKMLKTNDQVSNKMIEHISYLIFVQGSIISILMAGYLSVSGSDMGLGSLLAIAGVRLVFGYWITQMLKKDTPAVK
ncbi:hypothetical protein NIE88_15145 [Sporolactobacillus shoreicorticis]|uniref:Uncharacterized protein n=1 Tax=Sporolactobacillus shoreicorticis TaxID=1923877 RepID=A0ABW5S4C4_9BACL|nr:hypothetical protein [Sporolactobacillus shoreicorticis]MCO7127105.1 hypothetical protein [Sporolactobacillus shoreicorticis]